ncbi:MAG: DUF4349 domain-containing protein [Oscillospiraceae bacterium]
MKRRTQALSLGMLLVLLLTLLAGCGSNGASADAGYDMEYDQATEDNKSEGLGTGGEALAAAASSEKFVYTAEVYAQTLDYDAALAAVGEALAACGGYVESYSESSGGSYYSSSYYEGGGRRSASYVLRVPCEQFQDFLAGLSEECNVIDQYLYSENVTLQYVDMEARIKNLTAQEERLVELLAQAEDLEQVLKIESQLTETRSEIDSTTSSLKVLENRVSYSTVTLYLSETSVYAPGAKDSFGQRFLRSLGSSWEDLKDDAADLVLFLGGHFLQILLWAAVFFAVWRFLRARRKSGRPLFPRRKKAKKAAGTAEEEPKA